MRRLLPAALWLACAAAAASPVMVGDQEIRVPDYEGFTRVAPELPQWGEWAGSVATEGRLAMFVHNEAVQGSPGATVVVVNVAANPQFTTRPMSRELFAGYKDLYRERVSREAAETHDDPSRSVVPGLTFDDERAIGHTQCELHPASDALPPVEVCRSSVSFWVGERLLHITAVAHGPWAQLNASVVAGGYLGTLRAANADLL